MFNILFGDFNVRSIVAYLCWTVNCTRIVISASKNNYYVYYSRFIESHVF